MTHWSPNSGRSRSPISTAATGWPSSPQRTLTQTGTLPIGVTPLDSAIYHAAGRHARTRELRDDQWVRSALDQLRDDLERRGLAISGATRRTARRWGLAAGISADKPVGLLFVELVIDSAICVLLLRVRRIATRAAVKGTAELRTRHGHLSPSQSPAYATYGATGAAMGVALFGTVSLYSMDPAFAAEAEIHRQSLINAGGSTSSSSSCGSGGSSCGGGGGCGGGGCGG